MSNVQDFRKLSKSARMRIARRCRGFQTRAAERAGVSQGHISKVFWGHVTQHYYTQIPEIINDEIRKCLEAADEKQSG